MVSIHKHPLLIGRSRTLTRRYLGVAIGLFVAWFGVMGVLWQANQWNIWLPLPDLIWQLWIIALITVGLPTVQAYQNDGLLVSIVLGLPILLAFYIVLTTFNLVYPSEDLLWGLGTALQYGVPAGVLGFALGFGFRRLRNWVSDRSSVTA